MILALRIALVVMPIVLSRPALADGPKVANLDPEAKRVLDALISAYKALPAYADQGAVTLVVRIGDATRSETHPARISFERPNRLEVETDLIRLVSDGTTTTSVVKPLRKYLAGPAPSRFAESSFRNGPLGAIELGGAAGLPLVHALNLVTGVEPDRLIFDFAPRVVAEGEKQVEGKAYRSLLLDEADNCGWRFLIDPDTGLLGFIELAVDRVPADKGKSVLGAKIEQLRWAAGPISTERPAPDRFSFKPPEGFAAVAKLSDIAVEAKGEGQPEEANPLLGKSAPDFTLDVLDGPDTLRKVTKADLKGKVVVIDFWATWCGPCLSEMPDIQRLIDDYARAGKPVAVVALSIDQAEAGDLKEARATVEKTLTAKEWKLDGNPVGLVALDPLGKIAKDYGVEAIPFVAILDPAGTVRAVNVGVTRREVLAEQIDALLAGKSPIKKAEAP
ncbi:TlpA family protein disulfide reductase [Tundrisphaera sp. TA3]|uniref:TlpA family protein disulfide reductase n=1 Tax=Tundrisphaera sp. TA3 TaxID=3435775 RepID=UPI003EB895A1